MIIIEKFKVNLNKNLLEPRKPLCGVPEGSILGQFLFLLYINNMAQTVRLELFLHANGTCLIFQHNDVTEIEIQRNKNFTLICDYFVDNKLNIHFEKDKTKKSILFSTKLRIKNASSLNI